MTAKDYASLSASATTAAGRIAVEEGSPMRNTAELAKYYLRCAARELQRIAEWSAEREKEGPNKP